MSPIQTIQHCPGGLFPHSTSGFERTPFFPQAGETLVLGCRVSQPSVPVFLTYAYDDIPQPALEGSVVRADARFAYLTFSIRLPEPPCLIAYAFNGEGAHGTETFRAPSVNAAEVTAGRGADAPIRWHVCGDEAVSVSLFANLSDKATPITAGGPPSEEPIVLLSDDAGNRLAWMDPTVRLWMDRDRNVYRAELHCMVRGDRLFGFGEKFDRVDQVGLSPLSYVVEQFCHQREKTYLPIPFFFSDSGAGFLMHGARKTQFITQPAGDHLIDIRIQTECPPGGELFHAEWLAGTPEKLLAWHAARTGLPGLPPEWVFGPWMSSNGWNTQREALEQIDRMNELDIPATVMVLEAWSDEETFYIWNDAQYVPKNDGGAFRYDDFTFPPDGKWPDPKGLVKTLEQNGVKLVLWQIPAVKLEPATGGAQQEADVRYAMQHQLCVAQPDGTPYRIPELWFAGAMLPDFTNPETVRWWFDKRRYLVEEIGVAGFKTDGGEFLFSGVARLSDGRTAAQAHNDYPNLYIGAYHRFLEETAGPGKGVTFSRAGYTGAQRYPVHWAGDQLSDFADLRGVLTAGLSLGLSGVLFWGFDIGGFAGNLPSAELYLRAAAFAAFAPIMQFHSEPRHGQYGETAQCCNNDRSPWNMAAALQDERILTVYRMFAKLRMRLLPYLWREARHCVKTSRPMMAHLAYDYFSDQRALRTDDTYMLGRDLLVAPIVTEGAKGRTVYLPAGAWTDFWTGRPVQGGMEQDAECGLNRIPVFSRTVSGMTYESLSAGGADTSGGD